MMAEKINNGVGPGWGGQQYTNSTSSRYPKSVMELYSPEHVRDVGLSSTSFQVVSTMAYMGAINGGIPLPRTHKLVPLPTSQLR